jgi:pimeloyl-ACP methyl ester carboxylesterase
MKSGHVNANGLRMYYEIHGEGRPLVLLHGALSGIGSSFGRYIPELARTRQVIGLEMQAHGHTLDIDRPLRIHTMAEDTVAALRELGIEQVDLFGYSMGAGIALEVAIRHPDLVRKLVVASLTFNKAGFHPGLMEGLAQLQVEHLSGSPWQLEYASVAPHPEAWPALVAKVKDMNFNVPDWSEAQIRSLQPPTLIAAGDSDVVPEHAALMFRLLGGGVFGDTPAGLPRSRLAILPGTSHTMMVDRAEMLLPMLSVFLDATP